MSGAAHPQSPVRQQIMRDDRRARKIALACVASIAALLVALVLALAGDDSGSGGAATPAAAAAGDRGGRDLRVARHPLRRRAEEGTRGAVPEAWTDTSPATRYDGGPDEGTRGAGQCRTGRGARRGEPRCRLPLPSRESCSTERSWSMTPSSACGGGGPHEVRPVEVVGGAVAVELTGALLGEGVERHTLEGELLPPVGPLDRGELHIELRGRRLPCFAVAIAGFQIEVHEPVHMICPPFSTSAV